MYFDAHHPNPLSGKELRKWVKNFAIWSLHKEVAEMISDSNRIALPLQGVGDEGKRKFDSSW